jgi:hypothetical protein
MQTMTAFGSFKVRRLKRCFLPGTLSAFSPFSHFPVFRT